MSEIRFGRGIASELSLSFPESVKSVLFLTDSYLFELPHVHRLYQQILDAGLKVHLYTDVRVEPTDQSIYHAIETAKKMGQIDGIVAVGGGSVMDTAKLVNLFISLPEEHDLMEFVNAPIGKARPVPAGKLLPLICVPTTSGTGSESTGVAIFDIEKSGFKTGIAHRNLKPYLGLVDPDMIQTLSKPMISSTGFDVFCHAIESYTARPFDQRPKPLHPQYRPSYQGSNPVSDIWSLRSIELCGQYLPRFYENQEDEEARASMILSASMAAVGFGTAGVHLCHANSYPISSNAKKREYFPSDYPFLKDSSPFIPHGQSVVLTAPAVFRFCTQACPDRIRKVCEALSIDEQKIRRASDEQIGDVLSEYLVEMMQRLGVPNGLDAVGFKESDIDSLVQGVLPQHRVTKLSPRDFTEKDLARIMHESMKMW